MARRPILFTFKGDSTGLDAAAKRAQRDLQGLTNEIQQTSRAADRLDGKNINLDVNADGLVGLRTRLRAQLAELENIDITPDMDPLKVVRDIRKINSALRTIDRQIDVDVDVDRDTLSRSLARGFTSAVMGAQQVITSGLTGAMESGMKSASSNPYVGAAMAAGLTVAAAAAAPAIISGVGAALGGAITVGIGQAGKSLLEGFAQLEAADRKFRTVFQGQEKVIEDWARTVSTRGGVGAQEIKNLASGVQDLLVPRGFNRAEAAGITQSIVERGIALAEFSGQDKALGIEAVTKALLGEREQLKSLGVQIRQSDLNDWLKDNAASVQGMSAAQAEVVGTMALLKDRSKDAWAAYVQGGSDAEQTLDNLNAALANLKTDAIRGFGSIFMQVLSDIKRNLNLRIDWSDGGLSQWIENNRDKIRLFFLQAIDATLAGAEGFIMFANAAVQGVEPMLRLAQVTVGFGQALIRPLELFSLFIPGLGPAIRSIGGALDAQQAALGSWLDSWGTVKPTIEQGLGGALSTVRDFRTATQKALMDQQFLIEFKADLDDTSAKGVQKALKDVGKERLARIIASTEGSDDEVDRRLNRLAAKERIARIQAKVDDGSLRTVQDIMRNLTKDEKKFITVTLRDEYGQRVPGVTGQGGITATNSLTPGTGAPVVVQLNDGRLADFITASGAEVTRTHNRRYGLV